MSSQKMSNKQLVLRIKAGENVADNMLQLWQQNQGFIRSIAKKYAAYEEIEDLIQQGYFGMCNAVNGYDPENGGFFSALCFFLDPAEYTWLHRRLRKNCEIAKTFPGEVDEIQAIHCCHVCGA